MTGLNPPLTDISTTHCTPSISNITSINGSTENLTLDSYSTFTENYINGISCSDTTLKRPSSPESPPLRKSNPFLSQTKTHIKDIQRTDFKIKLEESNKNSEMEVDKHFVKTQKQNQQKLLLFMNTPENRAKLAGTNFNIINASLLSKLSSQAQKNDKTMNVISLKKNIDRNLKQETASSELTTTISCEEKTNEDSSTSLLKSSIPTNGISSILQTNVFQGLMKKDKEQNQEIDSGKWPYYFQKEMRINSWIIWQRSDIQEC